MKTNKKQVKVKLTKRKTKSRLETSRLETSRHEKSINIKYNQRKSENIIDIEEYPLLLYSPDLQKDKLLEHNKYFSIKHNAGNSSQNDLLYLLSKLESSNFEYNYITDKNYHKFNVNNGHIL